MQLNPVSFYKCLAEDTRLKSLLLISLNHELCVCDLITALDLSQPKISRHLAELRKCEILIDERRGKWVYYQINPALPSWAKQIIKQTAEQCTDYINPHIQPLNRSQDSCQP